MNDIELKDLSAFPANHINLAPLERALTLRDWFAGMAMQGFVACPSTEVAEWSYKMADAMLKERDKT